MSRPEKIDLFDLTDAVLEQLNVSGKFKLTHYDFNLKFSRDLSYPSYKLDIHLILFGQETAVTYYSTNYNTIPKIVNLLFVHLLDDGGFESIEHAICSTKRNHLEKLLSKTIEEINALLNANELFNCSIFIDEQFPFGKVDEKGLPIHELNIYSEANNLDLKIDLNNQYFGVTEKQHVLEIVNSRINSL
jgi:hypothetical protein